MSVSARLRTLVLERDLYSCVRCGVYTGPFGVYSIHHRRPRGMGGTKTRESPANLLLLCGSGTTGCHGYVESHRSEAETNGYIVRHSIAQVEDVPVATHAGLRVFTADGTSSETWRAGTAWSS